MANPFLENQRVAMYEDKIRNEGSVDRINGDLVRIVLSDSTKKESHYKACRLMKPVRRKVIFCKFDHDGNLFETVTIQPDDLDGWTVMAEVNSVSDVPTSNVFVELPHIKEI